MIRILAADGMEKGAVKALEEKGCEVVQQFYEVEDLKQAVKEFDALVVRSATKVRVPVIDEAAAAGRLKIIIRGGVGVDNIDVDYAKEKGIEVRNTPRASSQSVAELAMGHMFACARFLSVAGHSMREGKWEKKAYAKGIELQGRTLGIIGFGRIGQHLGIMAKAIGMKVVAFDIFHIPGIEEQLGIQYVDMDTLLAESDFISVHAPAVDGGAIINAETIAKMKDGVCIINTSRGANLDENALLEGLNSGKVRAAGLDVWASEPSKNEALYAHPMVSCTPHIGASTVDAQAFVHKKDICETEKRGSLTGGQKAGETVPTFKKRLIREALFGRAGRRCLRGDREVGRGGRRYAAPAGPACGARCLWLCQRGSAPAPGKTSFFPVRPRLRNKPDRNGSGKSIRQRYRNSAQKSTP